MAVGKITIEQVMRKIWPFYARDVPGLDVCHLYSGSVPVAAAARIAVNFSAFCERFPQ
jgi:hypothetical protein